MRALIEFCRAQVTIAFQLRYRVSLVTLLIGMVLPPVIYLVIWTTVARSGGSVGESSSADFAASFIVPTLVDRPASP